MTERFEKAYNALVRSFFEGTLAVGDCKACALGNIIADAQGGEISIFRTPTNLSISCTTNNSEWGKIFTTVGNKQWVYDKDTWSVNYMEYIRRLTGYNRKELMKIEFTFETNTYIHCSIYNLYTEMEILEDQYNGLSAVIDVLMELDAMTPENKYAQKLREHPSLKNISAHNKNIENIV
jgi:hypothetical protein